MAAAGCGAGGGAGRGAGQVRQGEVSCCPHWHVLIIEKNGCCRPTADTPVQQGVVKQGAAYIPKIVISGKLWYLGSYASERGARVVWDAANVWRTVVNKTGERLKESASYF